MAEGIDDKIEFRIGFAAHPEVPAQLNALANAVEDLQKRMSGSVNKVAESAKRAAQEVLSSGPGGGPGGGSGGGSSGMGPGGSGGFSPAASRPSSGSASSGARSGMGSSAASQSGPPSPPNGPGGSGMFGMPVELERLAKAMQTFTDGTESAEELQEELRGVSERINQVADGLEGWKADAVRELADKILPKAGESMEDLWKKIVMLTRETEAFAEAESQLAKKFQTDTNMKISLMNAFHKEKDRMAKEEADAAKSAAMEEKKRMAEEEKDRKEALKAREAAAKERARIDKENADRQAEYASALIDAYQEQATAAENANREIQQGNRAIAEAGQSALQQVGKVARGMVLLGVANEESMKKAFAALAKVQAGIDLIGGAVGIIRDISRAWRAYQAVVIAVQAAQEAQVAASRLAVVGSASVARALDAETLSAGRAASAHRMLAASRTAGAASAGGASAGSAASAGGTAASGAGMGLAARLAGLSVPIAAFAAALASLTGALIVTREAVTGEAEARDSWTNWIAEMQVSFVDFFARKAGFDMIGNTKTEELALAKELHALEMSHAERVQAIEWENFSSLDRSITLIDQSMRNFEQSLKTRAITRDESLQPWQQQAALGSMQLSEIQNRKRNVEGDIANRNLRLSVPISDDDKKKIESELIQLMQERVSLAREEAMIQASTHDRVIDAMRQQKSAAESMLETRRQEAETASQAAQSARERFASMSGSEQRATMIALERSKKKGFAESNRDQELLRNAGTPEALALVAAGVKKEADVMDFDNLANQSNLQREMEAKQALQFQQKQVLEANNRLDVHVNTIGPGVQDAIDKIFAHINEQNEEIRRRVEEQLGNNRGVELQKEGDAHVARRQEAQAAR